MTKKNQTVFSAIRPMLTFSVVGTTVSASAAMVVLSFAIPLTVLQAYDRIIAFKSLPTLAWLSLGCLTALVLNGLLEFGRGTLSAWTAARFVRKTDQMLIQRILDADPDAVARGGIERHLERFRALGRISNVIIARTLPAAAEAPFFFAYLALLVFIGGWAATPSILVGMTELLLAAGFRKTMFDNSKKYEEAERHRVEYLAYALERIHFIKAQALEHVVFRGFEEVQTDEVAANSHKMSANRTLEEFDKAMMSFTTFGTIIWGGVLVAQGRLTVGTVSACLFFASRLVGIARNIRRTAFALTETKADLVELNIGLALPSRVDAHEMPLPRNVEGRLEFDAVSFTDPVSKEILADGVSFTVRPGTFALLQSDSTRRSSGARAGALCRLAAGIIHPDSGQVLIDAYQSTRWDFRGTMAAVSYISMRSSVMPGTILENIASFDPGRREGALDVAQLFGLDRIVSRLPRGFETAISTTESGGLSASALRLVTIARALAFRPRLLVWDSADLDLDQEARDSVLEVMRKLRGATTVLINSRDPAFRDLADMVIAETPEPAA